MDSMSSRFVAEEGRVYLSSWRIGYGCLGCAGVDLRIEVSVEELCLDQERKDCKDELSRRHQDFRTQMNCLRAHDLTQGEHES